MYEYNVSNYLANKLLEHSTGKAEFTMPDTVYLALYTDDPTAADVGTEATGVARQAVAWDNAADRAIENTDIVEMQKLSGAADTVTHWGLRDADTAGNLLWFGPKLGRRLLGSSDTQYTITNPSGLIYRYTWTTVGTDPEIDGSDPAAGDLVVIAAQNFTAANNGRFVIVDTDTNWFEVVNVDGVAEATKTIGTGSLTRLTPTSTTLNADPLDPDVLRFAAGALRLQFS